jgi:trimeric autotransporter adhesin
MSRIRVVLLLALALASFGCGYHSRNYMGGAVQITQLMPSSETAGKGDFLLTVTGSGFGTDAVIYWGTMPQASSAYMSTTQVSATIPAADIANAGMVQVYVRSGGMNSNALTFTIQAP